MPAPSTCYHNSRLIKDEGDDYTYQEDEEDDRIDGDEDDGRRRSQRTAAKNANGKRASDAYGDWRVERRSSRIAAEYEPDQGERKRARTEERSASSAPSDSLTYPTSESNGPAPKENGAAAIKGHEIAMEQVPGKKKSKFWFYAVEPAAQANSGVTKLAASEPSQEIVENGAQVNGVKEAVVVGQNGVHDERADTPSALFSAEERA